MNSKNSILLVDPAFDPNTTDACRLLIKLSADNFSYAIIDVASNQLKVLYDQQECENPSLDLADKLDSDEYLALSFQEVKASIFTLNTLLVPNDLYDSQQLTDYGKYFTVQQSNILHVQSDADYNLTSVFNLATFIEKKLTNKFSNCKFYNHISPLLALAKNTSDKTIFLDFTVGSVNAAYLENGNLIFQNYFEISNAEEFNYYLLFMVNQLNIEAAVASISVSGVIHEGDKIYQIIGKYFTSISFAIPVNQTLEKQITNDLPANYYSSLLAIDICE
ncbi:MAG: DUF3822 family protein [Pedobacter sp.]|nr:MAG: DUF3822 family protein [Pedobacter sp.]